VKALLLDLDDTLLDYSGGVEQCWEAACAAAAAGVPQATLVAALAETRRWFWSDPARHRTERVNMPRAWTRIATHALERCGGDARLGPSIAEAFAARRRAVMALFPDALDCLATLRRHGLPLALVTNGDAREQRFKIERYDLARFFDAVVIEGELGTGKPDAVAYATALSALGVTAGPEVWMVGDHLEFDVAGPQRLGLSAAWLDRPGQGLPADSAINPDRILRDLTGLAAPTADGAQGPGGDIEPRAGNLAGDIGAPHVPRGAPNVGGHGSHFGAPNSQ
jgi:putative hydrolase of the HAD superfamily